MSPEDVLDFWFGGVDDAVGLERAFHRWFQGGAEVDEEIRARFVDAIEAALAGELIAWEGELRARLALILLLDQFPRNVFRREARAFAGDERALRLAEQTVRQHEDHALPLIERLFLLMPYQHAEDLAVQDEAVRLFAELDSEASDKPFANVFHSSLEYAHKHRDIIARFGRFPWRNAVLGRQATPAEVRWLATGAERFGQ